MLLFAFAVLLLAPLIHSAPITSNDLPSLLAQRPSAQDSCDDCEFAFEFIDSLLESNFSLEEATKAIISLCIVLKLESVDETVCKGIIPEFAPEVYPILVSTALEPKEICILLGYCTKSQEEDQKAVDVLNLPPLPSPSPAKSTHAKKEGGTVRVIHISDVHMDDMYTVGSNPDCGEPLCCRTSDGNGTRKAGKWGDYSCDLNAAMLDAFLQQLASINPQPDFMVWTGDNPPHDVWMENPEGQLKRIQYISDRVYKFLPNLQVFPAMGNHDTFPVDQFNRKPKDATHYDDFQWLTEGLASVWGRWLPEDAVATLKSQGYYTALVKTGLRVIALTTQWGDVLNFYILLGENQRQPQFDWLVQTLTAAENNGEKVVIIGHIPCGLSIPTDYTPYATQLSAIVNRFANTIVGQFFGHTHHDHFEIFRNNASDPTNVIYIAPSVTPFSGENPAYRIYELDGTDFSIVDYEQYVTNLTAANLNDQPEWSLEYSAKEEYDLSDLSPQSWLAFAQRMRSNQTLFDKWWGNYHAQGPHGGCDSGCQISEICFLEYALPNDIASCVVAKTVSSTISIRIVEISHLGAEALSKFN